MNDPYRKPCKIIYLVKWHILFKLGMPHHPSVHKIQYLMQPFVFYSILCRNGEFFQAFYGHASTLFGCHFVNWLVWSIPQGNLNNWACDLKKVKYYFHDVIHSCKNITTTLIQIFSLFYFVFFSKTNHLMII